MDSSSYATPCFICNLCLSVHSHPTLNSAIFFCLICHQLNFKGSHCDPYYVSQSILLYMSSFLSKPHLYFAEVEFDLAESSNVAICTYCGTFLLILVSLLLLNILVLIPLTIWGNLWQPHVIDISIWGNIYIMIRWYQILSGFIILSYQFLPILLLFNFIMNIKVLVLNKRTRSCHAKHWPTKQVYVEHMMWASDYLYKYNHFDGAWGIQNPLQKVIPTVVNDVPTVRKLISPWLMRTASEVRIF